MILIANGYQPRAPSVHPAPAPVRRGRGRFAQLPEGGRAVPRLPAFAQRAAGADGGDTRRPALRAGPPPRSGDTGGEGDPGARPPRAPGGGRSLLGGPDRGG